MNKPGRPSHYDADLKAVVSMAEDWYAGKGKLSVRALSLIKVGKRPRSIKPEDWSAMKADTVVGKGTPESRARRLQRRFHKLNEQGLMVPVSVYRVRNMERYGPLQRRDRHVGRAFYERDLSDRDFVEADRVAVNTTSRLCKITTEEVVELSTRGLEILKQWFPSDYSPNRI